VNLGEVQRVGPPETEDCSFDPDFARVDSRATNEQFWKTLEDNRKGTLVTLFGSDVSTTFHGTWSRRCSKSREGNILPRRADNHPVAETIRK